MKACSGLPISINWTFFATCYGWGATSDYWLKIGDFALTGAGWPKISARRGRPPPVILLLSKLGYIIFRVVYKSGHIFLPFCHNPRVWQTDGRTDRQTDRILIARPRLHSMQRGKIGPWLKSVAEPSFYFKLDQRCETEEFLKLIFFTIGAEKCIFLYILSISLVCPGKW